MIIQDPIRVSMISPLDSPYALLGGGIMMRCREDISYWCDRRKHLERVKEHNRPSQTQRWWGQAVVQWHWLHEMPMPMVRLTYRDVCNMLGWDEPEQCRRMFLDQFPESQIRPLCDENARNYMISRYWIDEEAIRLKASIRRKC